MKKTSSTETLLVTFPFYLLFLPFSFYGVAVIWNKYIARNLYYCSDPMGVLDFIPTFVHGGSDYYIASPVVVSGVWFLFVLAGLLLPVFLILMFKRLKTLA